MKIYSYDDWIAEAKRRFGDDVKHWRVVCPSCKTEQSVQDFLDVGVPAPAFGGSVGYSCIGRFVEGKGCDWTLGGLFKIHEVEVERDGERTPVFDFAPEGMKELPEALVAKLTAIANTQMEPQGWTGGAMPSSEDSYDEGYGDGRIELAREVVKALGIKVEVHDPDNDDRCELCDEWFPPGKGGVEEVEGKGYFACSGCRE